MGGVREREKSLLCIYRMNPWGLLKEWVCRLSSPKGSVL